MRIAICDDDLREIERLTELFFQYKSQKKIELSFHTFNSGIDLLYGMKGGEYDLVLLDIIMPGIDGIQTAKEIRTLDKNVKIIILSSSPEYAVESYLIGAYYYLLKPTTDAALFPLLDQINTDLSSQEEHSLLIRNKNKIIRIPFSRIEYVEVMNKTVFFHIADGSVLESSGSLSDFEEDILELPEFFKVHRSYIANLSHIQSLGAKGATTHTGHTIPISRLMYTQVKDAYIRYIFQSDNISSGSGVQNDRSAVPGKKQDKESENDTYQILFVDDEQEQLSYWGEILRAKGCVVHTAANAAEALRLAASFPCNCVLLDVSLADGNSYSLCQKLKKITDAPIVFLSCNTDLEHQLRGFQSGGIDYITKDTPVNLFWAKIEARLHPLQPEKSELHFEPLVLNLSQRKVYMDKQEIILTSTEFDLLRLLAENMDQTYSPDMLYHTVWGGGSEDGSQTVQVHMSRLRRKLDKIYPEHSFIETIWGEGYHFVPLDSF